MEDPEGSKTMKAHGILGYLPKLDYSGLLLVF